VKISKDVHFEGNFGLVRHLLMRRSYGSPHKAQIDFELGLRHYQTQGSPRPEVKFDTSTVTKMRDSFGIFTRLQKYRFPYFFTTCAQFECDAT